MEIEVEGHRPRKVCMEIEVEGHRPRKVCTEVEVEVDVEITVHISSVSSRKLCDPWIDV